LQAAFAEAYAGIANTGEFLVFMSECPLENAFSGGRLQSDNPEIVEGMKLLNGVGVWMAGPRDEFPDCPVRSARLLTACSAAHTLRAESKV
jgi:hypothetical protein